MSGALHGSIRKGDLSTVTQLLDSSDADTRATLLGEVNREGWNAVRVAVAFDRPLILRHIFQCGAKDATPRDKDGWTSLHVACFHGYDACVDVLLEAGIASTMADRDEDGRWPIHCAVQRDHVMCLEHLLSHRTDQNVRTSVSGSTALHVAASYGAERCFVRLLATQRARIALKTTNKRHRSVLLEVIHSDAPGAPACLRHLLAYFDSSNTAVSASACHIGDAASSMEARVTRRWNDPTKGCTWAELQNAFMTCVHQARLAHFSVFLAYDDFFELLFSHCVPVNARLQVEEDGKQPPGAGQGWMVTPLHCIFLTWNAPFIAASLGGCLDAVAAGTGTSGVPAAVEAAPTSCDVLRVEARRSRLRRGLLLHPSSVVSFGAASGVPCVPMSPMEIVFSSWNKKLEPIIGALFGDAPNNVLIQRALVDPSADLVLPRDGPYHHRSVAVACEEVALCFVPRMAVLGTVAEAPPPRVCLLTALLHLASTEHWTAFVPPTAMRWVRSQVHHWHSVALLVMDSAQLAPPLASSRSVNSIGASSDDRTSVGSWTTAGNGECEEALCVQAARVRLLRSLLESKFRQLTELCVLGRNDPGTGAST